MQISMGTGPEDQLIPPTVAGDVLLSSRRRSPEQWQSRDIAIAKPEVSAAHMQGLMEIPAPSAAATRGPAVSSSWGVSP